MIIPEGYNVIWDSTEFEIDKYDVSVGGYWLKALSTNSSFVMYRFIDDEDLKDKMAKGILHLVLPNSFRLGHIHDWKRYRGLSIVEDECVGCGSKKSVNWREIGDET